MIRDFNDFIEALFEIDIRGKKKFVIKELIAEVTKFAGIPISKSLLDQFFKEDKPKNAFRYIVKVVKEVKDKGKISVLIIDELQKIGDVKINNFLIYELFNLFIRLTKELHCCHVFAVTSDSLFIERVYSEAMLQGRCEYLLVDDFDYETTKGFLKKYGFSDSEIQLVWEHFGGKPVYLVRCVRAKKSEENLDLVINKFLKVRIGQIKDVIYELRERDEKTFKDVIELFRMFEDRELIEMETVNNAIRFCVKENILFVDPVERIVKPQSKLDLLAIRRILEVI
jgi:AAA+ ATPase superfamily predicted ATPase